MNRFPRVLGVRTGYDPGQVDALIRRIEATLGRGTLEGSPVTADDIRMARFTTKLGGYNELAVDYALDAFVVAIETRGRAASSPQVPEPPAAESSRVAIEAGPAHPLALPQAPSTAVERREARGFERLQAAPVPVEQSSEAEDDDAPTLPGFAEVVEGKVSRHPRQVVEALNAAWLETQAARVERVLFRPGRLGAGYNEDEVDVFLDRVVATLRGTTDHPLTADQVRNATFSTVLFRTGYAVAQVDAFLAEIADILDRQSTRLGEQEQRV
ncbi:DivIVA domain-containing protein [Sphaerisporangium fuscum]|uniref:DivIVA domain-containing protein n=1 Tax=Sphaerisporangium fuscum TaxID=2835868 RepID=UPI001BDBF3A4|nr:DivIVA domain-containing protein [Sphaerisporangium fuscum]